MDAQLVLNLHTRISLSITHTVLLLSNKVQSQFHKHQCQRHFTPKDTLPYMEVWLNIQTPVLSQHEFNIASLPYIQNIDTDRF